LRVTTRDRVADDHEIDVAGDVLRAIADERGDPFGREKVAHRRVDVLIGSLDVDALVPQHRGERRHRRAADANHVHLHETADSSMTTRGAAPATTRQETPSGSVIAGPVV